MTSATDTARLLTEVLARLQPHLPDGVRLKITPHRKVTTLQRADEGSIRVGAVNIKTRYDDQGRPSSGAAGGCAVRSLRPWVPFVPLGLRRRLTAQCAVETVLDTAYMKLDRDRESPKAWKAPDLDVKAANGPNGIVVSYRPPGGQSRIELTPIPFALL